MGRTLKTIISLISGLSDVSLSPKTNIIYLWGPQDTFKTHENPKAFLKSSILIHSKSSKIVVVCFFAGEETGAENPDNPSNEFLKILDMGSISSTKHETDI